MFLGGLTTFVKLEALKKVQSMKEPQSKSDNASDLQIRTGFGVEVLIQGAGGFTP